MKKILAVTATAAMLSMGFGGSNIFADQQIKQEENQVNKEEKNQVNKEEKKDVQIVKKLEKEERKELIKQLKYDTKKLKQEDIEALSDTLLMELSKDKGEIVSITTKYQEFDTKERSQNGTLSTMPTSDFKMTVVAQRIYEKSGDNFKFVAEGDWIASPFYELVDTIALAWSDNFTLYNDYAYTYRNMDGYAVHDYSVTDLNKATPEVGVGHDVDLIVGKPDSAVYLVAKVYKNNSSGTANVVGEYGHLTKSLNVSLSFGAAGGVPEVGMSVSEKEEIRMASPDYDDFSY